MAKQEKILEKQNELPLLRNQCAARLYYNCAEKKNMTAITFAVLSALSIFFPDNPGRFVSAVLLILPVAFDACAMVFNHLMEKDVQKAAKIRNHFDAVVLEIKENNIPETQLREINELTELAINRNQKVALTQIEKTGIDNPPGVKNWYSFSKDYSDIEAIHECQRQNIWWNQKLFTFRIILCLIIVIGVVVSALFMMTLRIPWIRVVVCLLALIVTLFEKVRNLYRYILTQMKIQGMNELLDYSCNLDQISALQNYICELRRIPVVGINFSYKKNSAKLSELYCTISR